MQGCFTSSIRVKEPERGDQTSSEEESKKFPVAVAWDAELLNNDLSAGNVDEGTGCETREDDFIDRTSLANKNTDSDTRKDAKVVVKSLEQRASLDAATGTPHHHGRLASRAALPP